MTETSENPDGAPPADERENKRTQDRHKLIVGVTMESDSHVYRGLSGDISEGGLFVATPDLLPVGTPVDLEFTLPGSEELVSLAGEVRWQRETLDPAHDVVPGVGVRFLYLNDEERALVERFLERRRPLAHPDEAADDAPRPAPDED